MAQKSDSMINWIKHLPKTEIHLHVEAVVRFKTFMELNQKYNIDSSLVTIDDYKNRMNFNNLSEMIQYFLHLQTFFRDEDDYLLMTNDLLNYALNNNIYYMEIFFSPSKLIKLGYVDFFKIMDLFITTFDNMQEIYNIDVRVIIDVSRSFGAKNAMNNLNLLLKYLRKTPNKRFIGIGLGGAEKGNNCVDYKQVFARAKKHDLHLVAHAGEEVNSRSIWDAIHVLKVERIGHGTSAIYDEELISYLTECKIPLEVCPTSNIITKKYVQAITEHPIRQFYDSGVVVTLNTDDPLLFDINLNREYFKLYKFLHFSKADLIQIAKNGLYATFLSTEEKDRYWEMVEKALDSM
ncbi:MAG: adenosine deaminase [Salinispira sp.]